MLRLNDLRIPLGRPRRKWKNNIKMDIKETVKENANWIHLVQDRYQSQALVNTIMNFP
jgi:hypothetical protein